MKELIAIYCKDVTVEEIKNIQTNLFDNGCRWYSSIDVNERKYKERISEYIIIENKEIFEIDNNTIKQYPETKIFNSPIEYLRYYKLKKLKTKIK